MLRTWPWASWADAFPFNCNFYCCCLLLYPRWLAWLILEMNGLHPCSPLHPSGGGHPDCSPPWWYHPRDWRPLPPLPPHLRVWFVPLKILTLFQLLVIRILTPPAVAGVSLRSIWPSWTVAFSANDFSIKQTAPPGSLPSFPSGFSREPTLDPGTLASPQQVALHSVCRPDPLSGG